MVEIPGTQLEKAASEVASEAGKTLVSAIGRRVNARIAVWSAPDEAKAEEIKKNITQEGDIQRQRIAQEYRREEEKTEVAHRFDLAALARRGMQRIEEQIIDEQKRLEWISLQSVEYAESDPDRNDAREIPDDWLKRFFKYATDVDEDEILNILAQCLAAAAIRTRPILSPKALDTLRFFELRSYHMFLFCAQAMAISEYLPADMLENEAFKTKNDLDLPLMIELGLIKEVRQKYVNYHFGDMFCTFSYDTGVNYDFKLFQLTYVGRSISDLLDRRAAKLGDALRNHKITQEDFELQKILGLNTNVAKSIARYLISQISDTSDCDITVRSSVDGDSTEKSTARRVLPIDEFPIELMRGPYQKDAFTQELSNAFIDEFDHFNKYQLPHLYTDDERERFKKIKDIS